MTHQDSQLLHRASALTRAWKRAWVLSSALVSLAWLVAAVSLAPTTATAGCGCTKPPPLPAQIRPAVTYSGTEITLFDPSFVLGQTYKVTFDSANGPARSVFTEAVLRRDLADGIYRMQLALPLPYLPLGPTAVAVRLPGVPVPIISLADDALTVAPQPVTVPAGVGEYTFDNYRAAVSRDGVVYISLNFVGVQDARVFEAQAKGYPLRFGNEDLTFYNRQGFLMQLLDESIPGLSSITSGNPQDSDLLHYSRHEFNTYFLQHEERQVHQVDPTDSNWHLDGTPHIDHDRQILEMAGIMEGGGLPQPGATPPFMLAVSTYTLFHHGLFGDDSVDIEDGTIVDSYDSTTGLPGSEGDLLSNGAITIEAALVDGDATGLSVELVGGVVTGQITESPEQTEFLIVEPPQSLPDMGNVVVGPPGLTLVRGSYLMSSLQISSGTLQIDNLDGPVTIYVTGNVDIDNFGQIVTSNANPEQFSLYVFGPRVEIEGSSSFYGVVYAPDSEVRIRKNGTFHGAFVGAKVIAGQNSLVHFDSSLSFDPCPVKPTRLDGVSELTVSPGDFINIGAVDLSGGEYFDIDGVNVQSSVGVGSVGFTIPQNLPIGSDIEIAITDSNGCRSLDTTIVHIEAAVEPPPPATPPSGKHACGLFGIECVLVWPVAAGVRVMRRRNRTRRN